MSILIGNDTRLVVQGITGREGQFHARQMMDYGTKVVAGETPGRGGMEVAGVPVYDTVVEAVKKHGANTSIVYVPAAYASDAILEAVDAGIKLVVCITEGIPTLDMIEVVNYLDRNGARLIGPNCPGLISPGQSKVGIIPGHICMPGPVGIVSRSGTLTYEVIWELTLRQIGQSTCVGIGGDPVIGTKFVDVLKLFQDDPQTEQIVMIGEIGGTDEEEAADFIAKYVTKPVVGFIAGQTAPPGKRMGHAGAIISGGTGTAQEKIAAMQQAGIRVGSQPAELAALIAEIRQTGGEAGTKAARRKSKAPSPGLKPK